MELPFSRRGITPIFVSEPLQFLLIAALIFSAARYFRPDRSISLPRHKFWALVRSQEKPVVLFTTRGFLIKRLCYVFPYQGVLFYTDAANTEAPDGVTLIGTDESFSMR